ncbi:MAG: GGDEF domain-containing protein [Elusimicrobia bacterium]|nr:GGDEF domain-containing protein [Elusimicrobiota bacterium]
MSLSALAGALALMPAASLWGAWPRRRSAAWGAAGAAFAIWAYGWTRASQAPAALWLVAGLWSLSACFYATYLVGRNADEYERLKDMLGSREGKQKELVSKVAGSKARSRQIETEQREVLILYGVVKGVAESVSWDDLRPKLEVAFEQYLRVGDFVLYIAQARAQDALKPFMRRRLSTGVGASWDTLERCLQERKLPLAVPHVLKTPERAVALPVFEGKKLMGYFYARVPEGADPEALLGKAQSFVDDISFAFLRIRLFQEVEELSQTDGLTGVYRRGILDEKLREEVIRARTFHTTFCLMLLDIDHFKSLNDAYGHPFGDQVLCRIGEILRASVYETDFVARYGGEEFAILLPRADPSGVLRKAETLRKSVESEAFELATQQIKTTISIGIAHFPRDGGSVEEIVRQADQALYRAKETGRNRVVDIAENRKAA